MSKSKINTRKPVKYGIVLLVVLLVGYNSIYIKPLDKVAAKSKNEFSPVAYADNFFNNDLLPSLEKGIAYHELLQLLDENKDSAFAIYGKSLAVGNISYFLVKGEGEVIDIHPDLITIRLAQTGETVVIAVEYVYGNAVRDASGLIALHTFNSTSDLNNVSEALNNKIRKEVLPPFLKIVKKGDKIHFNGAIELNKINLALNDIEILPIQLQIIK